MRFDQQLREMLETPGVRSVCLVDWRDGRTLTRVGAEDRVADTSAILHAIHTGPLCATQSLEEVVVTETEEHLLFAVLEGSALCLRVRMGRSEGNLAIALRRLRHLACTVRVPPTPSEDDRPHRRDRDRPRPSVRVAAPVDRGVLERVLSALRTLSVDRPRSVAA